MPQELSLRTSVASTDPDSLPIYSNRGWTVSTNGPMSGHAPSTHIFHRSRAIRAWRWLAALCFATNLSTTSVVLAQAPFSPQIRELHFSQNGRYVLVETDSEITVLSVRPLAILFRVPGQDVRDAQFTPDSKQLVLIRGGFHVQRWSIAGQSRVSEQEVPSKGLGTERLSPDGRYVAGVDQQGTLWLLEVASGETALERKGYGQPVNMMPTDGYAWAQVNMDPSIAQIDFSPDGRYFLAAPALPAPSMGLSYTDRTIVWDMRASKALRHNGDLVLLREISPLDYYASSRDYVAPASLGYFVFLTPDRLLIADMKWAEKGVVNARLAAFPSGKEVGKPRLPTGPLFRAADPAYVIVRPCGPPPRPEEGLLVRPRDPKTMPVNLRSAAAEVSTGDAVISETPALDAFHNYYIAESSPGTVGLYERGKGLQDTIALHQK